MSAMQQQNFKKKLNWNILETPLNPFKDFLETLNSQTPYIETPFRNVQYEISTPLGSREIKKT